jgi:hypothetical protein
MFLSFCNSSTTYLNLPRLAAGGCIVHLDLYFVLNNIHDVRLNVQNVSECEIGGCTSIIHSYVATECSEAFLRGVLIDRIFADLFFSPLWLSSFLVVKLSVFGAFII